jgi:hypothetical protein
MDLTFPGEISNTFFFRFVDYEWLQPQNQRQPDVTGESVGVGSPI